MMIDNVMMCNTIYMYVIVTLAPYINYLLHLLRHLSFINMMTLFQNELNNQLTYRKMNTY